MQARYYNPYLCRFVSQDPSGFSGGLNWFAYANGNPVSYLDPFGLNAGTTGDSSWTWMGLYNSIASAVVPGQVAWNNAMSAWQAGNYGTAAMDTANMIGQQALFVLTLGGSSAATPTLNAAEDATSLTTPLYNSSTRAFWTGETTGLPAAQASGASILQLSPEAQAAFDAGNPALMIMESTAWAQGAVGENAAVFLGNGAGRTFWSAEFPQLMNNLNNGSLNQIIFHF